MKLVYFVRHGESTGNAARVLRGPRDSLTLEGERQASFLARRFQNLDVDLVITSDYERARQTGAIINEALRKPLVENEWFGEKTYPHEISELLPDDPLRVAFRTARKENEQNPEYRYAEGDESFADLKERGDKALAYLLERPEEKILVVTHGWFLRVLLSLMMHGDALTNDQYLRIWKFFTSKNTGITICEHNEENVAGGWRMQTWMDHAHLAEPDA